MTSASEDHVARCVALERSYVHEVYEQFHETPRARPWPRINHFLSELEPGSLVCDVGCGNGKYLNINQSVFQVGVDRCSKLCEMAREKENEVLVCDNLSLPFRDESFDAVLSIAVIHHFATTERRVVALRELARLLRIGGRLIISVWAMEQRHRKFESQDVLVPWHRPHRLSTPSLELCTSTTNTSEEDVLPAYHAYTQSDTDSNRSLRRGNNGFRKRGRSRHKGRSIDPNRSSSPSSSSLSSPNETCYSFVRRAIQKLAGGKRGGSRHRPWFLDSWSYCSKEPRYEQRYDPDGCEDCDDVHDLPIELRRIEEDEVLQNKNHPFERSNSDLYKGQKSKSLSDIQTIKQESIIRSRSNVSNLRSLSAQSDETSENGIENKSSEVASELSTSSNKQRPKLVKQKKSLNEEDGEDLDKPLNQRDLVEALPDFRLMHSHYHRRGNVFKQSSMNEELMSTERLREKERVRKNIQKQASLNEDLIYRRYRTLDSLRDSIFSVSTQKRFQLIKNGFTTKLKNSTTNIEKVTSSSLKNGFVRILQSWKTEAAQSEKNVPSDLAQNDTSQNVQPVVPIVEDKNNELPGERRHSREDGSDSSKDSSLQSDTSVDSEDSFASVIFVPKQESQDLTSPTTLSPVPTSPRVKTTSSGPTSPRLKQSSCPTSPRIKQIPLSVYPLLKTPGSPKTAQQLKQIPAGKVLIYSQSTICNSKNNYTNSTKHVDEALTNNNDSKLNKQDSTSPEDSGIVLDHPKKGEEIIKEISKTIPSSITLPQLKEETLNRYKPLAEKYKIQKIPAFRSARDLTNFKTTFDKTKMDRLKKIREILNQRPGFGKSSSSRSAFPLVRRSSTDTSSGKSELVAKSLPRLLSLELFNPETDDMDSDSSGVSSPDSIESVISVDVDTNKDTPNIVTTGIEEDKNEDSKMTPVKESSLEDEEDLTKLNLLCSTEEKEAPKISPTSMSLLEAAANVANSLDDAVGAVIKSSPRLKRKQLQEIESSKIREVIMPDEYKNSDIRTTEFVAETTRFPFDTLPRNPPILQEEPITTNYSLMPTIPSNAPAIPPRTSIQPPDASFMSKFAPSNGSIACEPVVPPRIPSIPLSISNEPLISSASWSRQCYEHLTDFADQISENLLQEIDKYQEESKRRYQHKKKVNVEPIVEKYNDPYIHKLSEEIEDLTRLSEEIDIERKLFYTKYNSDQLLISSDENKRCDSACERRLSISESAQDKNASETKSEQVLLNKATKQTHDDDQESVINKSDLNNLISVINNEQGFNQTNIVTKISSRENSNVDIKQLCINSSLDNLSIATTSTVGSSGGSTHLLTGLSQESSDAGDISERTTASSGDYDSRRGNDSTASVGDGTASTASVGDCGSTASLSSCTDWTRTRRLADGRSSSEEMPDSRGKRGQLTRQHASVQEEPVTGKTGSASSQDNTGGDGANEELRAASDTSQESLPSDSAGGAITYHRYYHVFREGELDQLIERYVENLHIISSYYDHASWCVVAEKVQVWTI